MNVSGFSFVKNAVKYDYPLTESVRSILPIVSEFVLCLGDSEDDTESLVRAIGSEKIKIVRSVWNKELREGGKVLAEETNKAMDATSPRAEWLFYLQADEVVHEKDLPVILEAMEKYREDERVEGLLFRYIHFYGSHNYVGDGRKWYSREVRVIRNDRNIRSYRDAQGFRLNGRKLRVKEINASIYHYGWARSPLFMQKKHRDFGQFWTEEAAHRGWVEQIDRQGKEFDYSKIDSLALFEGTHPQVMHGRIAAATWDFKHDIKKKNFKNFKHRLLYFLQQSFNWRPFEYRNYDKI